MRRAFVIQLHHPSNCPGFEGRVEHVDSGRDGRFRSPEELLSFIEEALDELGQTEDEDEAKSSAASNVIAGQVTALNGNI